MGLSHWLPNYYSTTGGLGQILLMLREIEQKRPQADVLLLGSSHAYRGFDVRAFSKEGIAAFKLGSTSQTPLNSCFLLKKYLP